MTRNVIILFQGFTSATLRVFPRLRTGRIIDVGSAKQGFVVRFDDSKLTTFVHKDFYKKLWWIQQ